MLLSKEMEATLHGVGPSKGLISTWVHDVKKLEAHVKELERRETAQKAFDVLTITK